MNSIYNTSIALLFSLLFLGSCTNINSSKKNNTEVNIGTQTWAIKNLGETHFKNGDTIMEAKTAEDWQKAGDSAKPAWCYYNNDSVLGKKFGKIYNWFAVNDIRGLSPKGWHIPNEDDWTLLIEFCGGRDSAGAKLKSNEEWVEEGNGPNTIGFSGLPGGYRSNNGEFRGINKFGCWWSATEFETSNAWYRYFNSTNGTSTRKFNDRRDGLSVRCLKD